jgi:hypothetical protein
MSLPSDHPAWVRTQRPPEYDKVYGDRLYHWDLGGEFGVKDGNGVTWYRLNCSYWFGDWIEENCPKDQWKIHGGRHRAIYIVCEELLTLINLKWL